MEALAGKRILVAEDNAFSRDALCEMLAAYGAAAVPAGDGDEAVRLFAQSREGAFDAAILDLCLPGMDGFAVSRAIRRMRRRDAGRLLILAHSSASARYAAREAEASGMDACLQKPLNMRELARILACASGFSGMDGTA